MAWAKPAQTWLY